MDTDSTTSFAIYVAALGLSGLLFIVLAILGLGNRIANGLLGLVAGGYAGYLMYEFLTMEFFTYRRFIYAYIFPFFAVYQLYKGLKDRKNERAAVAAQAAQPAMAPQPAQEA
ncbi:hypothetical protein Rhe02_18460 [Rhizocola hellebori]|uniref:Uncharacterized protein n=1 Tax=Rhizocola hellebori TaxID=1392758 RepID=A0A8J3Q4S0_9ACTN|nr:hypothetical protein [Rhizocola hellebori]GIH03779.1 hypothetical protein Rhe02_18460 [Rhizocola hellebori]